MLRLVTTCAVGASVALAVMAVYVRRRRGSPAGVSIAVLLGSAAWWAAAYAMELSTSDVADRGLWGDLKYVGICLISPAFLVFVLQYTGRRSWVTRRRLLLLAIEPLLVWVLLAVPATHDLIRYYVHSPTAGEVPVVGSGPVFWIVLGYANVVLLVATALFLTSMWRLSRTYRVAALTMTVATLLPWVVNLAYNLNLGPFGRLDLTPFAFTLTGAVLVAGLYRERLIHLAPLGWTLAVTTLPDPALLCDAFGHVRDANPAATTLLGRSRADLIGSDLTAVLPALPPYDPHREAVGCEGAAQGELQLTLHDPHRQFDVRRHLLPGRDGTPVGELVMLRDITDRVSDESRLRQLLEERTRIAETLRSSLLPAVLPSIPGCSMAALYEPAGGPHDVAGDFYDVFRIDENRWGIVLGDVAGKGAQAGAITGLIRYTVRTLAQAHPSPSKVLLRLNSILLRDLGDDQYCTIVFAVAHPTSQGLRLTLSLGGHHPPLLRRANGHVDQVGALGTAPGLVADPSLSDTTVTLGPGDLLCLFTDGLVEARNRHDFFGTDRAAHVLASGPHEDPRLAVDHLALAVQQFRAGPPSDDLAVLALRALSLEEPPPQAKAAAGTDDAVNVAASR